MSTWRNGVHAISTLAGLSVVSSSLMSMFLANNNSASVQVTNACSARPAAAAPAAGGGSRALGSGRSQIRLTAWTASTKASPTPTSSPSPSTQAPSITPGSPNVSVSPNAGASGSASPSTVVSPQPSPNRSAPVSPTPGQTSSASSSPTPSTTPSTTPPPSGQLCVTVQSLKGTVVHPGTHARYAIWVWITGVKNGSAKISLSAKPHSLSPVFTVCQPSGRATCKLAGMTSGQHVELQARIAVPKNEGSSSITLTATGTSAQATSSVSASYVIQVQARTKPSQTPTPTPSPTGTNLGDGGTLPPGTLPPGTLPPGTAPATIPGLPSPTGNAGSVFPQVLPSPSPSPAALPPARSIRATDVSAGLPLNVRLLGGQLVGLAILAAAVTIAVARLSLRKRPRRTDDSDA